MDGLSCPPPLLQMVFSASYFFDVINVDLPLSLVTIVRNWIFHIILLTGTNSDVSIVQ